MSIVHNKISGLANTDAGLVGGADWDAAHVHGDGSLFPLGLLRMTYTYANDFCQNTLAAGVPGAWSRAGGQFSRALTATPPVRSGAVVSFYAVGVRITGLPAGWSYVIYDDVYLGQDDLVLETLDTGGNPARPPQNFTFECLLMGVVS